MKRYTITEIREDLERKRGEPFTEEQFANLIAAYTAYISRRGLYTKQAVYNAVRRGWMSVQMAHFFKNYALL